MTPASVPAGPSRRIVVIGVSSTGKSTLALRLAARHGVPAIHLDNVADRLGHTDPTVPHAPIGEFPDHPFEPRPLAERLAIVRELAARDGWVAEGPFIEWLGPLLERADTIFWLDQLGMVASVREAVRRAFRSRGRGPAGSDAGSAARPGVVARVAGLLGHGVGLIREAWDVAGYHWWRRAPGVERDIRASRWDRITRRQVAAALAPYGDRVTRVRDWSEVDALGTR